MSSSDVEVVKGYLDKDKAEKHVEDGNKTSNETGKSYSLTEIEVDGLPDTKGLVEAVETFCYDNGYPISENAGHPLVRELFAFRSEMELK
jgi:hypothetical protein